MRTKMIEYTSNDIDEVLGEFSAQYTYEAETAKSPKVQALANAKLGAVLRIQNRFMQYENEWLFEQIKELERECQ